MRSLSNSSKIRARTSSSVSVDVTSSAPLIPPAQVMTNSLVGVGVGIGVISFVLMKLFRI